MKKSMKFRIQGTKNKLNFKLDKKQHQTGEITSVQGQNYYVRNFKFKLGHFIGLFDGYNLYNSWEKYVLLFLILHFRRATSTQVTVELLS